MAPPNAGQRVSVIHYDDGSDPDRVRDVTRRLLTEDRVDLLFGPYSSVLSMAAVQVAEQHQRLMWNQGGASDAIYNQGFQWLVGVLTPASEYLAGLLPMVRQADAEAVGLGLLSASPGAFPRNVIAGIKEQAATLGFQARLEEQFSPTVSNFTMLLEEADRSRVDVLVGVGRIANDVLLAQQIAERRPMLGAVAVVAGGIDQFSELGNGAEGFLGPSQWEPGLSYRQEYGPSAQQVIQSVERHGYRKADYPLVQAYAAGLVAQRCVEQAKTLDNRVLRRVICDLDLSTFYGRFKINPVTGRQIGRSVVIVQWQQGRKAVVWPPELQEAKLAYPWHGLGS
jgi:branched-chain amino acid transport system substrate-binding protein